MSISTMATGGSIIILEGLQWGRAVGKGLCLVMEDFSRGTKAFILVTLFAAHTQVMVVDVMVHVVD
jgi:hypothetical protein